MSLKDQFLHSVHEQTNKKLLILVPGLVCGNQGGGIYSLAAHGDDIVLMRFPLRLSSYITAEDELSGKDSVLSDLMTSTTTATAARNRRQNLLKNMQRKVIVLKKMKHVPNVFNTIYNDPTKRK